MGVKYLLYLSYKQVPFLFFVSLPYALWNMSIINELHLKWWHVVIEHAARLSR